MEPRRRELPNPAFSQIRSERFVEAEDGWYFKTRENILVGPFTTAFDAHLAASLLCARLSQLDHTDESPQVIRSFISTSISQPAPPNPEEGRRSVDLARDPQGG